jgi:TonB family protein
VTEPRHNGVPPGLGCFAIAILCAAAFLPNVEAQIVTAPREILAPAPEYPEGTSTEDATGTVVVDFVVDKTGRPIEPVIVSSSNPAFDEAAIETIRKWRYAPATLDGKPFAAKMEQTLIFERNGDVDNKPYGVAQPGGYPPDYVPAQVTTMLPVVYPYELRRDNVTGQASATMQLDTLGRVVGVKIVSCTRPEFGFALAAALQGFEFTPAASGGAPVEAVMGFRQQFNSDVPADPDADRLLDLEGASGAICGVSQLDEKPRPLSIQNPKYPHALVDPPVPGDAEVEFIIEEDGSVDLPRVVKASRPEFGYAAVEAVASWRFEPPLLHGSPTLAKARVPFKFQPGQDSKAQPVLLAPSSGAADADAPDGGIVTHPDTPVVPLFRPAPVYPAKMGEYHIGGDVVIKFVVDKSGNTLNPVVIHSNAPVFEQPAIEAILRWKFKSATENGEPVNTEVTQELQFEDESEAGHGAANQYDVTPDDLASQGTSPPKVLGIYPIVYPFELERTNVAGEAKARMLLSDTGHVVGVRIVSCSRQEFGLALAAAVQGFTYTPAKKDGSAVPSVIEFDQEFDSDQLATPEDSRLFFLERHTDHIHPISALDAPPHPLSIRHPLYPSALVGTGLVGDATVEFLIQENGWVRLPRIVAASEPDFGYAAAEAVASWAFRPPTIHGQPVVARARVSFKFKAKTSSAPAQ